MSKVLTKEEILQKLREEPAFQHVLSKASNPAERRMIKSHAEEFLVRFYNGFYSHVAERATRDPVGFKNEVLKVNEELIRSGSNNVVTERDGRPEKPRT